MIQTFIQRTICLKRYIIPRPCTQPQFFERSFHPALEMNCDENNFLQEGLVLDDVSAKSKPDDDSKSKEKEINFKFRVRWSS